MADYHLCPFGQFTKVFLFQRLSGTAPLQENIAALQMPLSRKISCLSPAADDLGFPQKLMNCSTGTHLHTTPGLQELPGHADGRHTSVAAPVGTDGMSWRKTKRVPKSGFVQELKLTGVGRASPCSSMDFA